MCLRRGGNRRLGFVDEYVTVVEERVQDTSPVLLAPPSPATTPTGPVADARAGEPALTLTGDQPVGAVGVAAGTVLVARADECEGLFLDIEVSWLDDPDLLAVARLCDPQELGAVGADENEWIDGEAYIWLPGTGDYEIVLSWFGAAPDVRVDLFVDPEPSIVRAPDLDTGDQRALSGIADTVVYLTDPADIYDATGFDHACAVEVYWGSTQEFPRPEPFDLTRCEHSSGIDFPPTDMTIPVVVFARTDDPIAIELIPR